MGIINGSSVFCWRTAEENKQQQLARRLCACRNGIFSGLNFPQTHKQDWFHLWLGAGLGD